MADLSALNVPRLAHIGLYTKDMEKAIAQYEQLFGIGPWLVMEGETVSCTHRGCDSRVKGRLGMAYSGKVQLELIQILEGSDIYAETLGEGKEGLHHLGFTVKNLEERIAAAREEGIEVLQRGLLKQMGIRQDYAYFDTLPQVGIILEFMENRFLGIKTNDSPGIMKLIARIQKRFNFPRNPI
jgi:catechol 2,3-dioxygenase-like lactoylglutathione lyase family enzyme